METSATAPSTPPADAAGVEQTRRVSDHRRQLMLDLRCAHCAERAPPEVLLRAVPCASCGERNVWSADEADGGVVPELTSTWRARRYWVYALVGVGSLVGGALPLVATLLTFLGMAVARYGMLRAALRWLTPARRAATALTLHLGLVLASLAALVAHELLTLLPVVNLPLKGAVSVLGVMAYTELALRLVERQLRRDHESPRLDAWEWLLPSGLVASCAGASVAVAAVLWGVYHAVGGLLARIQHWGGA